MGRLILALLRETSDARVTAAIEAAGHPALGRDAGELAGGSSLGVTLSADYAAAARPDTVTLDFTVAGAALEHLRTASKAGAAIVVGTTGFSAAERTEAESLARETRAIIAPNMSVGVNVLVRLVEEAARLLGPGFEIGRAHV